MSKLEKVMDQAEAQLLQQLRSGSPQAVRRWFAQYHRKLVAFISYKVSDAADAEEIAQETFINCLRHLPLFRGESGLWVWMQSIARHEVADYYRKRYAKRAIQFSPLNELVGEVKVADAHETSEKVRQVFQTLSLETQELLLLKYIDQKKVKDIARELGKSVKSVESDLFRARQAFRQQYVLADR